MYIIQYNTVTPCQRCLWIELEHISGSLKKNNLFYQTVIKMAGCGFVCRQKHSDFLTYSCDTMLSMILYSTVTF